MQRLLTNDLWKVAFGQARRARRKMAAIAYVTRWSRRIPTDSPCQIRILQNRPWIGIDPKLSEIVITPQKVEKGNPWPSMNVGFKVSITNYGHSPAFVGHPRFSMVRQSYNLDAEGFAGLFKDHKICPEKERDFIPTRADIVFPGEAGSIQRTADARLEPPATSVTENWLIGCIPYRGLDQATIHYLKLVYSIDHGETIDTSTKSEPDGIVYRKIIGFIFQSAYED
jgi:hypothetical protein